MEGFLLQIFRLLLYIAMLLFCGIILMLIANNILYCDLTFKQSVALLVCADIIFNRPTITIHENNSN